MLDHSGQSESEILRSGVSPGNDLRFIDAKQSLTPDQDINNIFRFRTDLNGRIEIVGKIVGCHNLKSADPLDQAGICRHV